MSTTCPTEDELLQLMDGGLLEDRANLIREHARGCSSCSATIGANRMLIGRIAAPMANTRAADVEAVMRRLDEIPRHSPQATARRPQWAAAAFVALAASVALFIAAPWKDDSTFQPRGTGTPAHWSDRVSVSSYINSGSAPIRIENDTQVPLGAAFITSSRNLEKEKHVYLLSFIVDSQHTVHWLYPAHTDATQDPTSVLLEPSDEQKALPDAVVPDAPALGRAELVTVLSLDALPVSRVESLTATQLNHAGLRDRFPNARIAVRSFTFTAGKTP